VNKDVVKNVLAGALATVLAVSVSCASERKQPFCLGTPTLREAENAEYRGIYDYPVRLADGRYDGEPFVEGGASRPTVQLLGDLLETGALEGDETKEAVVLIVESSRSSGSFVYLAVIARRTVNVENTSTILVGDRVQIRSLGIVDGKIIMEVIQHGPEDAMCCPSQKARRTWVLEGGELVEKSSEITGTLSFADLSGTEWVLARSRWTGKVVQDPPITIVFEGGRVSGSSGCNAYFAEISESSPGEISISDTGMTRMVCSEEIMLFERGYLEAIDGAVKYGFLAGKLALTCKVGDEIKILLFNAVEPIAPDE